MTGTVTNLDRPVKIDSGPVSEMTLLHDLHDRHPGGTRANAIASADAPWEEHPPAEHGEHKTRVMARETS
jgi:hypothetical protein